jgi:hypothetical protein
MHSIVRDRSGIAFVGGSYGESFVLADVRLDGRVPSDEVILYLSAAGLVVVAPLPDGVHRVVAAVDAPPEQPSAAYVQALLDARGPRHNAPPCATSSGVRAFAFTTAWLTSFVSAVYFWPATRPMCTALRVARA